MSDNDSHIADLRSKHRRARSMLSPRELGANASALAEQSVQVNELVDCKHVASYIAIRGEIDTLPLMHRYVGNNFYLPLLRGQSMYFAPWRPGAELLKKNFGLLEPDCRDDEWINPAELDVVLVPLVVFDQHCNRIGQGGGFYDRTFEFLHGRSGVGKPALVGVAHESQREPALQVQTWDVPLDLVITESSVYRRH